MSNFLETAHNAGVQQALRDSGLSKQAGLFTPTDEKRLARQLVEGGWFGRIAQPLLYGLGGAALGAMGGAGAAVPPAGVVLGSDIGQLGGMTLSALRQAPRRGNRLAHEILGGSPRYADTGIPEARRRAVARAVLAESGGRKAGRQLLKVPLMLGGAIAGAAPAVALSSVLGPAAAGPLALAEIVGPLAGIYGGHRVAHNRMPVRVPAETKLEAVKRHLGAGAARLKSGVKTPAGKAALLAALLGGGAVGYTTLQD